MRTYCLHYALPFFLLAAPGGLSPAPAATVTTSASPTADTFVTTGSGTNNLSGDNFGAAGALSVAAPGKPGGEFQSLLRFDLSSARSTFDAAFGPGNWAVQSAALRLTAASPNNALFNATAAGDFGVSLMASNAWAEGTGTPNNPTADGVTYNSLSSYSSASDPSLGTFAFGGATSGSSTYSLGLPAAFTTDVTSGGLASLRLSAADSSVSYLFNSRTFGTTSARPVLTVTAVPEPAGMAAAAVAGAVLLLRRRR